MGNSPSRSSDGSLPEYLAKLALSVVELPYAPIGAAIIKGKDVASDELKDKLNKSIVEPALVVGGLVVGGLLLASWLFSPSEPEPPRRGYYR